MSKQYPSIKFFVVLLSVLFIYFLLPGSASARTCDSGGINCKCQINDNDNANNGAGSGLCYQLKPEDNGSGTHEDFGRRDCNENELCYFFTRKPTSTPILVDNTPQPTAPPFAFTTQGTSIDTTLSTSDVRRCTTSTGSVGQCQLITEDHGVLISSDEKTKDCSENQICYIGLPPRPTSIPQPDCAGSDGCACKQFASPGNMIEQIFGADFFNNMRSAPIVGGVVASIDDKAANIWLTGLFAVNSGSPPPDDLVPGANAETHIKFLSGCDDGNVCVSTMNIQKYAKKNVTVQEICISKTAFGTELRNISLGLPSKIVVTPAEINQVSRDKTEKMLVAADANDPQREMYAKLATSCFEHIPYSTIVYEALEKPVFTFDGKLPLDYNGWLNGRLDPDNGESTTDNLEKDDFQEGFVDAVYDAANGVVNAYTGQPLLKSSAWIGSPVPACRVRRGGACGAGREAPPSKGRRPAEPSVRTGSASPSRRPPRCFVASLS